MSAIPSVFNALRLGLSQSINGTFSMKPAASLSRSFSMQAQTATTTPVDPFARPTRRKRRPVFKATRELLKSDKELKTATTHLKSIKISPWKLDLVATQIRGMPLVEALLQLKFHRKQKSPPVIGRALKNASNLMSIRHDLLPEDLLIDECFVTRGFIQKGLQIMGRGRVGLRRRAYSHLTVKVKEIDYDLMIKHSQNRFQAARWQKRKENAEKVKSMREDELQPVPVSE